MLMLNFRNVSRMLGVITLGSVYLPILFLRLPSPFHSPSLYLLLWLAVTIIFRPALFTTKPFIIIGLSIILFYIGGGTFWNDVKYQNNPISISFIISEFAWVLLAFTMFFNFIQARDYRGLGIVVLFSYAFIAITSVTSIIGFTVFPEAARLMAVEFGEQGKVFSEMGIGTYGFFVASMSIIPILIYFYRVLKNKFHFKLLIIMFVVLLNYAITKALNTTLIIITLSFVFLYIKKIRSLKYYSFYGVLFVVFSIFILNEYIAQFFYDISYFFSNEEIQWKIRDIGRTIETSNYNPDESDTYTAYARISRVLIPIESFFQNPIIGGGYSAGHAHWLDRLGLFGLLGFIPWILIFRIQIKTVNVVIRDKYLTYYYITILALIIYGLLKGGSEVPQIQLALFFLAPSGYFLKFVFDKRIASK